MLVVSCFFWFVVVVIDVVTGVVTGVVIVIVIVIVFCLFDVVRKRKRKGRLLADYLFSDV